MFLNMITNASQAMGDEGTLTIRSVAKPSFVEVSFEDTGSGIPEPILGQVLEPFFTTESGRSAHGLGLSMAKGFAEQSGGAMAIHSRSGFGTEIALLFPVHVHSRY